MMASGLLDGIGVAGATGVNAWRFITLVLCALLASLFTAPPTPGGGRRGETTG